MKKFPKILRLGHKKTNGILSSGELIITEKLDGNNFRFEKCNDSILFGSRNVEFKEDGEPFGPDDVGNQFREVAQYITHSSNPEHLDDNYCYFGENMIKHTLEYDWDVIPQFLGFAIWDYEEKDWLHPLEARIIFEEALGLDFVPLVEKVEDLDGLTGEDIEVPESEYRDGKAEGVVLWNTDNGLRAKVKTEEFKEVHDSDSGGEKIQDDTQDFVDKYCTDARMEKVLNKLTVDEGKDLEMSLMEHYPMRIVDDIMEEEKETIVRNDLTVDFKKVRKFIGNRCVSKLKTEMQKNAE